MKRGNVRLREQRRGARGGSAPVWLRLPADGRADRSAFTLIELMVAVALMSVIILGLMAMFNQTQRAFRTGMTQTDILESGRFASDMLAGELEQITPAGVIPVPRLGQFGYNFWCQPVKVSYMALPGGNQWRTNILDDVFFLVHQNQTWSGIGYFVRTGSAADNIVGPVGSLYRFETNVLDFQFERNPDAMFKAFLQARSGLDQTNVHSILDGVVDFQVQPVDADGWLIPYNPSWYANGIPPSGYQRYYGNGNIGYVPSVEQLSFWSNAVPAYVQLQLGVLEQQILQRYQSIPVPAGQQNFLSQQAGNVHLFRQRVSVRKVDPSAYP